MRHEDIIINGTMRTVAYARDASGRANAQDFLDGECPPKDAKRIRHWIIVIAEQGEANANRESFVHERGPIHAFKSFQARVGAFRIGNTWLLTHGFLKKKDQWPKAELDRADRIRAEHLAREGTK
jgi:hypothetical protein